MYTNDCPKVSVHPVWGALRNVKLLNLVNLRSAFNTKNLILSYQCPSANSSLARAAGYEVIDAIISMFSQQIRSSLIQPLAHRILCQLGGSPTVIRQDLLKCPCLVSLILWLMSAFIFSTEGCVKNGDRCRFRHNLSGITSGTHTSCRCLLWWLGSPSKP